MLKIHLALGFDLILAVCTYLVIATMCSALPLVVSSGGKNLAIEKLPWLLSLLLDLLSLFDVFSLDLSLTIFFFELILLLISRKEFKFGIS